MILVCGGLADRVTELVCARLDDCGYEYRLLDLGSYPTGFEIHCRWDDPATPVTGYLAGPDWRLELGEISGVYVRLLGLEGRRLPESVPAPATASVIHELDLGLLALFEDLPCPVVNRLRGSYSNNSKVLQALLVRRSGLLTPPTLVTNDPDEASRFLDELGEEGAIYKSLSGVRSIVRRLEPEQRARLPLLRHGPVQLQAYVPGDDVRVHVVGDDLHATRVRSKATDYRYARRQGHQVEMEPAELPEEVAEACRWLARELGLLLAGVDLRETPSGEYYCFEVNPSPGFLYYERGSGQPISSSLANLLHRGTAAPADQPGRSRPSA